MTKLQLASVMAGLSAFLLMSSDHVRAAEKPPASKVEAHQGTKVGKPVRQEEPGERARRELDEQADRLEAEARRAMQSICRGC